MYNCRSTTSAERIFLFFSCCSARLKIQDSSSHIYMCIHIIFFVLFSTLFYLFRLLEIRYLTKFIEKRAVVFDWRVIRPFLETFFFFFF